MAYNEQLADRIRFVLQEKGATYSEKKMFGGIAFMVDERWQSTDWAYRFRCLTSFDMPTLAQSPVVWSI
jgi:hypothetical protein